MKRIIAAAAAAMLLVACHSVPTPDEVDACRTAHAYKVSIREDNLRGISVSAASDKALLAKAQAREDEVCKGIRL